MYGQTEDVCKHKHACLPACVCVDVFLCACLVCLSLCMSACACVCTFYRDKAMPRPEIAEELKKGCDGLLCLLTDKIDRELVEVAGPRLKIVSTMSVGYNHIDTVSLRLVSATNIGRNHMATVRLKIVGTLHVGYIHTETKSLRIVGAMSVECNHFSTET